MNHTRRTSYGIAAALMLAVTIASNLGGAATPLEWTGASREVPVRPRLAVAEDRYAMAGGCYGVRAADGRYVVRAGSGFAATATSLAAAEPFHFQATDLGSYLLFGSKKNFLAASEGALGTAAYAATGTTPGGIVGGITFEESDHAADRVARSAANVGRGASVVAAATPSPLADFEVEETDDGFTLTVLETSSSLTASPAGVLGFANQGTSFTFEVTDGCAAYPEIEVNVDGPVLGGQTPYQEVRGYVDAHLHMMAFEFLGGRARCGRPWHRYGVAYALIDCPDHQPGGEGAVLEQVLSGPGPHDTSGWPTFKGWPRYNSLTHEQVYYKWLERAWRGGLRMFTNLLVDNNQLCKIYPYKRNSCNEMDGVRLQAARIRQLQDYIDAQNGGPGRGWFRIVDDPFEARRVINEGRLAVVLGIEVSVPLDCGLTVAVPRCTVEDVEARLDEVYDLGVRQMELTNKFDNALSGVTGDAGTTGVIVNAGNKGETGNYWKMETCKDSDGDAHDKLQYNVHDQFGAPKEVSGRDSLVGGVLSLFGSTGVTPVYPAGPHCNVLGLSDLGKKMIEGMARRGMIFDPDHMAARARTQAMDLLHELGYSGVVSSHGWADNTIYPRVYEAGGFVAPYGGGAAGFVSNWRQHRTWRDPRFYFGFGYGADTNGFGAQGGPRGANAANKLTYPFTGFGGVTVHQQRSGSRVYDLNTDGVAHYGLYADWYQDLRNIAGPDGEQLMEDLARGTEAYLQTWERAMGIRPNACRADVEDLADGDADGLSLGMSAREVVFALGQPDERAGTIFRYCFDGGRTGTLTFDLDGELTDIDIA